MYGYIYRTLFANGKYKYIGKKKSSEFLGEKYLGSGGDYFQKVKNKYYDTATVELIEKCYSEKELNEKEAYWIDYYNAVGDESYLNIASGGQGGNLIAGLSKEDYTSHCEKIKNSKRFISDETRKKMSEAGKIKVFTESHRNNLSKSLRGKSHNCNFSIESRNIISKSISERNKNRVWINNGSKNKFVDKRDIEKYKDWNIGRIIDNSSKRNRIWVNNGYLNKHVDKKDLDLYMHNGYTRGFIRNKDRVSSIIDN